MTGLCPEGGITSDKNAVYGQNVRPVPDDRSALLDFTYEEPW